jgi:hypothetical protein
MKSIGWFSLGRLLAAGDDDCAGNPNNRQQAVHGWSSGKALRRYVLPRRGESPRSASGEMLNVNPSGRDDSRWGGLVSSQSRSIHLLADSRLRRGK